MKTAELLRSLRPPDADRGEEIFTRQQRLTLLETIVAAPPSPRRERRRRRWTRPALLAGACAAAAAVAAALVLAPGSAVNPPPAQAVVFQTADGGDIIATVTHPFAAQAQLDAAFAQRGFDIHVHLLPVSPSIVGTVISVSQSSNGPEIQPLQGGKCLTGGGGCPIGIDIPKDFSGSGDIWLGRPALPGETYASGASAFAPGEILHCSGLLGGQVSSALPVFAADKLTVTWREPVHGQRSSTTPPATNYIQDAELMSPGQLLVTTAPTPWPDTPGSGSQYNRGC